MPSPSSSIAPGPSGGTGLPPPIQAPETPESSSWGDNTELSSLSDDVRTASIARPRNALTPTLRATLIQATIQPMLMESLDESTKEMEKLLNKKSDDDDEDEDE